MATYRRRLPATSSTIPTRVLLTCSATLIGASAWLILDDRPRPAVDHDSDARDFGRLLRDAYAARERDAQECEKHTRNVTDVH